MAENQTLSNPGGRRTLGRLIGAGIVAAAAIMVVVTLVQWEIRPQTDDATVRANFVGIAPQVSGHIVELHVRDNQLVKEGDLLFLIDPRPYKIALERARATLALTRAEVDGLKNSAPTAVPGIPNAQPHLTPSAPPPGSRTGCAPARNGSGNGRRRDRSPGSTVSECRRSFETSRAVAARAIRHRRQCGQSPYPAGVGSRRAQ